MHSPRPLLVFDGQCGFCRMWIERWRHATGDAVEYAPYQDVLGRFPQIPREQFATAVKLIEPAGRVTSGAEAVLRALALGGRRWPLALYQRVPGVEQASEACYRFVARHRDPLAKFTRLLWGAHVVPPGETLTVAIFLRLLGVIFALAFISLGVQFPGLAGPNGILPARDYLAAVAQHYGAIRYFLVPSVAWLGAGDAALRAYWIAGLACSLLLALGVAPVLALFGAWFLHLSLISVGQEFFWFQWDALLSEVGFAALFLAPLRWRSDPLTDPPPRRAALFVVRWLAFRLMVSSALVKLTSGDSTWRNLTALTYHYQTQPLPPWTAWYAHHAPAAFQRFSAFQMFVIEGLAPFLIWTPRQLRFVAVTALVFLQTLILVTGNYGIFNLLAILLCVALLDDGVWPRRWRERLAPERARAGRGGRWPRGLVRGVAIALVTLSVVPFLGALQWPAPWLAPLGAVHRALSPLEISNAYGLFAVMTTSRDEIQIEGSADGTHWRPYAFKYKPGDPQRRPGFVTPDMPRLDWQMWFASLGDPRGQRWFFAFCDRLLQGSPPVLRLLATNPFPDAPPRFVRATLWNYRFTDAATRRATGAWWACTPRGLYCPVLMRVDGRLAAAPADAAGNVIVTPDTAGVAPPH